MTAPMTPDQSLREKVARLKAMAAFWDSVDPHASEPQGYEPGLEGSGLFSGDLSAILALLPAPTERPDLAELRRLAEGATTVRRDANGRLDGEDAIRLWVGFHDAMTPQVAIALLSEIEGLKAKRDRLKLAICGGEDVPGSINAVSVDDCERFIREERSRHDWSAEQQAELDSLRTQAPDSWRPIETAPKDGTMILACRVHRDPTFRPTIYEGRFGDGSLLGSLLSGEPNPRFHNRSANCWDTPTHWMPLPAAPALRPQTAESETQPLNTETDR